MKKIKTYTKENNIMNPQVPVPQLQKLKNL